ncbi:hypothetical protein IAT38_001366 [Cryptococcus sp. DSM 104549]
MPTFLSRLPLALILFLTALRPALGLIITWPADAAQCDMVTVSWTEGVAPYTIWIHPIGGVSFRTIFQDNITSAQVPLQLSTGTRYIAAVTDATDYWKFLSFGPTEITTVRPSSNSSCVADPFIPDFEVLITGTPTQCSTGFRIIWNVVGENGPYTFSPFPLDQSFRPYDVALGTSSSGMFDWVVNLPEGTRFSVMMNSKNGHSRARVGGIYQVLPGYSSSCISLTTNPTGAWPSDITINIPTSTSSTPSTTTSSIETTTSSSTESSTTSAGGNAAPGATSNADRGGVSIAAIAGGAGGAVAAVLLLLAEWLLWSRRRKRKAAEGNLVDLYEDRPNVVQVYGHQHAVTPFVGRDPAGTGRLLDDDGNAEPNHGGGGGSTVGTADWIVLPFGGIRTRTSSTPSHLSPTTADSSRSLKRPLLAPLGQYSSETNSSVGSQSPAAGRSELSFMRHEDGGRLQS